ncbi:uncharacterized protein LOC127724628 [Mytilus californianus]|uniref:uncharacterized protein LOC127724628 n=1 Tax=Mytilus californianus TaxID=6549 RepID=UPI002248744A|nr:uncharacterized protein LOC127724628 [Mytilus californianus]
MCFLIIAFYYLGKSAMDVKTCFILSSLLASIICDVQRVPIPKSLRRCLRTSDQSFPMTDEQISTSCLLQFLWSNRQLCDKVSKQTFDWLSSLVEKSQQRPSSTPLHASGNSMTRSEPQTTFMSHPPAIQPQSSATTSQKQLSTTTSQAQTTGSQLRQRKEYRMLTDQERDDYHKAINDLKKDTSVRPNKYDALAEYHQNTGRTAHGGVAFVGWHRYYLVMYELALQEKNPNVMLPYWDSTLDSAMENPADTVIFTEKFIGKAHETVSVPFGGWIRKINRSVKNGKSSLLITKSILISLLSDNISYTNFLTRLEDIHKGVHGWVGGDMNNLDLAPFDPIFYMHHAFIDCIWELYRDREKQKGKNPEIYPDDVLHTLDHQSSSLMANLPPFNNVNLTNADGYKDFWTETYYTCAPQPSCSFQAPKCGSKWLKCDIFRERCVSEGSEAALPSFTPEDVFEVHNRRSPTSRRKPLPPRSFTSGFPSSSRGQPGFPGLRSFAPGFPSSSRGQPVSAGLSGRKITAEEFFSALKTLKKQPITIANTPRIRFRPGTPGNQRRQGQHGFKGRPGLKGTRHVVTGGRSGSPSNINTQRLPQIMPSIDELKIPRFQKACGGNPVQNSFRLDCKVGKQLWVFVPVKVVNLRHGDIIYASYPVDLEGRKLNNTDVFSDGQPLEFTSNLQANARSKRKSCSYDKSGLFKVRVSSYGLNYYGIYEDTVFLDNKRTVSTEISYIGIKNPEQKATRIFITAVDECGIACQPMILIPGRQKRRFFRYRNTQGAIRITANGPRYYSNTYRGAESLVWRTAKFSVPQQDENQIPIVFVCDYRNKNPWS